MDLGIGNGKPGVIDTMKRKPEMEEEGDIDIALRHRTFKKGKICQSPAPSNLGSGNERKSSEEEDNPASCSSDEKQLLKIFPEEIWIMVLDKVQDPTELEVISISSSFFKKMLKPRRQEYLFPKILPVLINWYKINTQFDDYESDYTSSDDSDDDDDNRRTNSKLRNLGKIKVLDLRLVCHCWNKSVESYVSEHPLHLKLDGVNLKKDLSFKEGGWETDSDSEGDSEIDETEFPRGNQLFFLKFKDANQVDDFMDASRRQNLAGWNPIFHRTLVLEDTPWYNVQGSKEDTRKFWESISEFMEKYGQQIWFCEIRLQNNISGFSYYFKIREWLELMPNLKTLHWVYPVTWEDVQDCEGYFFGSRTPIFLKCKLEDKVRENPLPKLEHIQMLKTDDLPYPIFREFIKRNDRITKLQFHRKFPPPPQYEEFYEYDFANGLTNLTELSMILWRKEEIKELEKSVVVSTWPVLQKLSLFWGDYNASLDGYNCWLQIFTVIEKKCTGPLTNLTLRLPQPIYASATNENILKNSKSLRLNLPYLQCLKLIVSERNTSLDFILPLKDILRELNVVLECSKGYKSNTATSCTNVDEIIQFFGYHGHGRLLRSNIWSMFPKLSRITLKIWFQKSSTIARSFLYRRKNVPEEVLQSENASKNL